MPDSDALSILIPDVVLPAEGTPPAPVPGHPAPGHARPVALLEALTWTLFARTEAIVSADLGRAWRHAYVRTTVDHPGRVWLDLTPGFFELDFNLPIALSEQLGNGQGSARQRRVAAVRRATRPFSGCAVPLLAPDAQDDTAEETGDEPLSPLAIWLATPAQLAAFSRDGSGHKEFALWSDDADAEVEGRGVREIALAAAIFLVGARGTLSAATHAAGSATVHAVERGVQTPAGGLEVLRVTSQTLHQAPPRMDRDLLADAAAANDSTRTRIIVDIASQRAYLLVDGRIAVDTPVSTGRAGHNTPRGTFTIIEKIRDGKFSTLYGSSMPFWMRLGETAVGLHVERLPGQAASHGCVRLPRESAKVLFEHTPNGTEVEIVSSWTPGAIAQR